MEIPPPDPYEVAIEVEAQVGPRSPSPTPFKIAESLASTGRKGFSSSYGRGNPSHVPSHQQSGRFDSPRQGKTLQSRSSSPSHGNLPFRRSESTASLSKHNFDGGGWSRGMEPESRNSLQSTQGRRVESGTLPRNFKSLSSSVRSQPRTMSDFRSALRKTEVSGSLSGRGRDSRSSSPTRRDYNPPGQMSLRKTEISSSSSNLRFLDSRNLSPSRRTSTSLRDSHSCSPPRRNYSSSSQSLLRKSESIMSLSGHSHHGRCGSPIREGYDIESQALLRNPTARNGVKDQEYESPTASPSRRGYDTSKSVLRKTESSPVIDSRSLGRRGYETPTQYQLRKTDTSGSLHSHSHESRNSSPSRKSYEAPSQSLLRKSEINSSVRSPDSHSLLPSRKSYDYSEQRSPRKTETSSCLYNKNHNSRNSSPSRKGNSDQPGCSILRNATNGDSSHPFQRKNTYHNSKSDSSRSQYSYRESTYSPRSSSLSRAASPSRHTAHGSRTAFVTLETPRTPSSNRSDVGRHVHEDRCPSPNDHNSKSDSSRSPLSYREPSQPLRNSSLSRSASPSRQTTNGSKTAFVTLETPRSPGSIRSGAGRYVHEDRCPSVNDKRPSQRARSPSPSPQIQLRRHTSSQSSMESLESGQLSVGSTGRNKEEYAMMADVPKVKMIHQREEPGHMGRPQNQQSSRRQELFKPARSDSH